jgi:hypothetical protein
MKESHETVWLQIQKKLADKGMKVYVNQIINKWKKLKKGIRKRLTAIKKMEMNPSVGNIMTNLMIYFVTASTRVEA